MTAVSKSAILAFASKAWQTTFAGTSLDMAIAECLAELNSADLLQGTDDSVTLAAGDSTLVYPSSYKSIIAIQLTDAAGHVYDPLLELPGGIRAYRYHHRPSAARGRPQYFVADDASEAFRLYPTADAGYATHLDYWRTHPASAASILYPAKFQHLLDLGAVYWEAVLRSNDRYMKTWGPLYYAERAAMESKAAPILRSVIQ